MVTIIFNHPTHVDLVKDISFLLGPQQLSWLKTYDYTMHLKKNRKNRSDVFCFDYVSSHS